MKWTKSKPTEEGRYWVRMKSTRVSSEQLPRVVHVLKEGGELVIFEAPDYDDPLFTVAEYSENFDWSDECVALPEAN